MLHFGANLYLLLAIHNCMDPPHKAKKLIKTPLLDNKLELVFANIYNERT